MGVFLFLCGVFVGMMLWEIYPEWPFRSKKKTGARERRGQWGVGVPQIEWGDIEEEGRVQRARWEDISLSLTLLGRKECPMYQWDICWSN